MGSLYLLRYYASVAKLGGIFAFGSYLPKRSLLWDFFNKRGRDAKGPPMLFVHGERDNLIPINWAEETVRRFPKHIEIEFESIRTSDHEVTRAHGTKLLAWIDGLQERKEKCKENRSVKAPADDAEKNIDFGFESDCPTKA